MIFCLSEPPWILSQEGKCLVWLFQTVASTLKGTDCCIGHLPPPLPEGSDHDFDCYSLWAYQEIYQLKQRIAPPSASPMRNTGYTSDVFHSCNHCSVIPWEEGWMNATFLVVWKDRTVVWTDSLQARPPKTGTGFNYSNWIENPN